MSDDEPFRYDPLSRETLEAVQAGARDFARMLRAHHEAFVEMGFDHGEAFELTRLRAIATMHGGGE